MNRKEVLIAVFGFLAGMVVMTFFYVLVEIKKPAPVTKKICNDGWTYEEKDGKIVETYLPANDTCKKQ